jgi:glycosyltransferase involved in cell wall biosynthesis
VDRGIVLGHCLKKLLTDVLPEDRIDVVYNGIDTAPFEEMGVERKDHKRFKILFAGLLEESKGYFDVIKALSILKGYHPNVEVILAGRWQGNGSREKVESYIRRNNLAKQIRFAGVVTGKEKIKLFKSCDVFTLPTYFYLEGQPVVILEAMAAGLPIITADRGSIKEMVSHGENGFIISPSSPHQIAERIAQLIQDKGLRKKMGLKSQNWVKEKFNLDQYIEGVAESIDKAN